jgi:ubiquinone biosynthesis protein
VRLEVDGHKLTEELFHAYLKQVLVDGLFHADPHPGNVFLTEDGRIALVDLGMVGRTTPGMQEDLFKLLLAISERESEEAADIVIRASRTTDRFDRVEFKRHLGQILALQHDSGLKQMDFGATLMQVSRNAADHGLVVPSELTLLGKTLLQLDEIGRILDPGFDPNDAVRRNVSELMAQHMREDFSRGHLFRSLMELRHFARRLPSRMNKVLSAIANAEFEIKIRALDAENVVEGIQKVANRIAAGVILASLIIGAALLTQVPTTFRIFGYPGLAMLLFLFAAAGGFWLLLTIFAQDHNRRKKP